MHYVIFLKKCSNVQFKKSFCCYDCQTKNFDQIWNTYLNEFNTHYEMLMRFVKIICWRRYGGVFIFPLYFLRHWIFFKNKMYFNFFAQFGEAIFCKILIWNIVYNCLITEFLRFKLKKDGSKNKKSSFLRIIQSSKL